jgi:hypothetical protein
MGLVSVIRGRKEREAQLAASLVLLLLLLLLSVEVFFSFFSKIPNLCLVELVSVPPLTSQKNASGLEIEFVPVPAKECENNLSTHCQSIKKKIISLRCFFVFSD